MVHIENKILIKTDAHAAFDFVNDIERWPTLFPPCRRINVLKRRGNMIIFEIEAMAKNEIKVWKSKRVMYPELQKVEFEQLQTFPPIKNMKGEWIFKRVDGETEIILIHQFELEPGTQDLSNKELFFKEVVEENSMKELSAIKAALEKK